MIRLICPVCGAESEEVDLADLLRSVKKRWEVWEPYMTDEQKKTIERFNNPQRLEAILNAQGYLHVFCQGCIIDATIRALAGF